MIARFVDAVAQAIQGLPDAPATDPRELATALPLLNERYLMDRLVGLRCLTGQDVASYVPDEHIRWRV